MQPDHAFFVFKYVGSVDPSAVMVHLERQGNGEPGAWLSVPPMMQDSLDKHSYPDPGSPMSVASAVAYGVFLSLNSGKALRLTGDAAVWAEVSSTLESGSVDG